MMETETRIPIASGETSAGICGHIYAKCWHPGSRPEDMARCVPLILLHDSLGAVALWRDFPALLAQGTQRPVIAYDRLGFGRSDAHPGPLPADFVAREGRTALAAVLSSLGVQDFALLGHSVGGGMAVCAAVHHGARCRAVVTVAAQAFVEARTLEGIRAAKEDFARPGQMQRLEKYHGDKAAWVLSAWVETWLSEAFCGWRLDDVLPRLHCPVLAIHGTQDEYGSPAHPERICALAGAGAQKALIADGGHLPHREQPELVAGRVAQFLAALAAD